MGRLFWKFFLAIWLVLLLAALGVGSIVWLHKPDEPARDPLLATGPRVAFDLQMAGSVLDTGGEAALRALLAEAEGKLPSPLRVIDENGTELLGRPVGKAALDRAQRMADIPGGAAVARRVTLSDGRRLLLFVPLEALPLGPAPPRAFPGPPPGPPPGIHQPGPPPWLPLLFGLVASLGVSALLAWYVAKPIRLLRQALDQAAGGQLNVRVQPLIGRRRDELADLGRNFDHMAQRLQSLLDAQRRLLHDVSHELRSPLARIQAAVGLAGQHPDKAQESLDRVAREAQRLDELVGEVLTLARLESMPPGGLEENIDMNGLLSEVVADARYEAQSKGVAIAFQIQGEMPIRGRTELIYRAVENVLRNAVRHTPAAGTVALTAYAEDSGRRLCIEVRDQGPGVPSEELAMIFKPFFRGQDRKAALEKGYGLGLAIAQRAVATHGGTIRAENTPPAGLCVRIELPGWAAQERKNP
jgi:two-component system OmpR family sensor kinase